MPHRREFLGQLGRAAAAAAGGASALAFDAANLHAEPASGEWDTSWLDRVASAKYRTVFNAAEIADGSVLDFAERFYDHFHEVHGTADDDTRAVIVFRHLGTPMALDDEMWDKYRVGEAQKINDSATSAPARRNVFWKAGRNASPDAPATTIEALAHRGMISLVCNLALQHWAQNTARAMNQDKATVYADAKAGLLPGAILVPSGIYALIRAQNAGCAYMPGA